MVVDLSITGVRSLLQQAGYKEIHLMPDETVSITDDNRIITVYFPVHEAITLSAPSDLFNETNLLDGHEITYTDDGYIQLPDTFVRTANFNFLLSYSIQSGLKDADITRMLSMARIMTITKFGIEEDFEKSIDPYSIEAQYQLYMLSYVMFECILNLNNVNAIQGDGNFSITYFSEMSKLWGEGHTVQALMDTRMNQLKMLEDTIHANAFQNGSSIIPRGVYDDPKQFYKWIGGIRN